MHTSLPSKFLFIKYCTVPARTLFVVRVSCTILVHVSYLKLKIHVVFNSADKFVDPVLFKNRSSYSTSSKSFHYNACSMKLEFFYLQPAKDTIFRQPCDAQVKISRSELGSLVNRKHGVNNTIMDLRFKSRCYNC